MTDVTAGTDLTVTEIIVANVAYVIGVTDGTDPWRTRQEAEAALRGAMVAGGSILESTSDGVQSGAKSPDAVVAWLATCLKRAERAGVVPSLVGEARDTLHEATGVATAWRAAEVGLTTALDGVEKAVACVVGGHAAAVGGDAQAALAVSAEAP